MAKHPVYIAYQPVSDVEMADGNTLLYHIAWPHNGTVSIIAESMDSRLRSGTTNISPTTCNVIPQNYCVSGSLP